MDRMIKRIPLLAILYAFSIPTHAADLEESLSYYCDSPTSIFHLALGGADYTEVSDIDTVSGEYARTCKLGVTTLSVKYRLYEPGTRGMCSAAPGGVIEELKINDSMILQNTNISTCLPGQLSDIRIKLTESNVEATFCGSYRAIPGCFRDNLRLSEMPQVLYGSLFPFDRYRSKKILDGTMTVLDDDLLKAVQNNDIEKAGSLLRRGARIESTDDFGHSPIVIASMKRQLNPGMFRVLLSDPKKSQTFQKQLNESLNMLVQTGDIEITTLLLDAGADPNSSYFGKVALAHAIGTSRMYSIADGNLETVKLLLEYGAHPNRLGMPIKEFAKRKRNRKIYDYFDQIDKHSDVAK